MTRVLRTVVLTLLFSSIMYAGIRVNSSVVQRVWIDASRPSRINAPFDVVAIGPNGERGLWIGPDVGRGWRNEAGGDAIYQFEVQRNGTYYLWAYCLWHDECTNAIYACIDDLEKAVVGNDPIFCQWHWVRGFPVHLKRGMHRLMLSNHSDNIALLHLFLTNSSSEHPDRSAPSFIEMFYEGFDGCDNGNFVAWKRHAGKWLVQHPSDIADLSKKILIGSSEDLAMITFTSVDWSRYILDVSVKSAAMSSPGASASICCGVAGEDRYYALQWSDAPGVDSATMKLVRRNRGHEEMLAEFRTPWQQGVWHDVEIRIDSDCFGVKIDGAERRRVRFSGPVNGGIGLRLEGRVEAHFDDIHVRMLESKAK